VSERCPKCGSRRPPGAALGELCPQCLFGLGLATTVTAGLATTVTAGRAPQISTETESLLRDRSRVGALVIFIGVLLFIVRDMLVLDLGAVGSAEWWWAYLPRFGVLALYAGAIALLSGPHALSLARLRQLEVPLLWIVALWFAFDRYVYTREAIARGSAVETVWALAFAAITYFAFLSAYGFLVPNTWRRALEMTAPLAVAPLVVPALIAWRDARARAFLIDAGTVPMLTSMALMMAIGVMIAAWGAHRIHTLRIEAFEAKRLGQYVLTERLGAGGMGEVWKAEHSLLVRPAAIKLIKADLAGIRDAALAQDFAASFEREAQATASLRSIHTVELYDFGITADSTFYYVMELLDGLDLETMVKRYGPLPPARVAYLLEQVCDSLADAHANGLVHGDIKPANIQVCRMGRRHDFVKVLDFGLVKPASAAAAGGSAVDRGFDGKAVRQSAGEVERRPDGGAEPRSDDGAERRAGGWRHGDERMAGSHDRRIIGTPAYMAPEVATGSGSIDGRADIYSLGGVGYWLLTGEQVFEGASPGEVLQRHQSAPVTPPSQRGGGAIPAGLEALILRCLEKDPAARPQSADELAAALLATGLAAGWTQEKARAWWLAHRQP